MPKSQFDVEGQKVIEVGTPAKDWDIYSPGEAGGCSEGGGEPAPGVA